MADVFSRPNSTGVFFNPSADRRAEFQSICGNVFPMSLCDNVDAPAPRWSSATPTC
jgi:hypothetical protein